MFWRKKGKQKNVCTICGNVHEEWPALVFDSPIHYNSEIKKEGKTTLTDDFCVIEHDTKTHYYIRVQLKQKVINCDKFLAYGLWVSLSEKNYKDYKQNFNNDNYETGYFGWLSNALPEYVDILNIPMNVFTKKGNERPQTFPHDDFDHPFVKDFYNGITREEAEKRIHEMLNHL